MTFKTIVLAAALMACAFVAQANTIYTVHVGNPGNAADNTGYGSVGYDYNIGKYEVTAGQYTAFLNAVGGVDNYGLYSTYMSNTSYGSGIARSGGGTVVDPYTYTVADDFANRPVNYVSWGDAARFTNWLQTGTTETGAYSLNGHIDNAYLSSVSRNAGATYVIPTENEWYKASYYKGGSTNAGYWDYPTGVDSPKPGRDMADLSGNNANYTGTPSPIDSGKYTTLVGQFQNSDSAYGTFDQGGNVWEWNESVSYGSSRGLRGGSFGNDSKYMLASSSNTSSPTSESNGIGFRVASLAVPEPGSIIMLAGIAGMSLLYFRRRNA